MKKHIEKIIKLTLTQYFRRISYVLKNIKIIKKCIENVKNQKQPNKQTQTNQSNQTQPSLSRPQNNKITESNFT